MTEKASQRVKAAEVDRDKVLIELAKAEAELTTERSSAAALDRELIALREVHVSMQEQNEHLVTEEQKAKAVAEEIARRADDLDASHKHERHRADKLADELAALQPIAQRAVAAESANEALQADAARLRDELAAERTQREALAKVERVQATDLASTRLEKITNRYWSLLLKKGRAIVPANGWYEMDGREGLKTAVACPSDGG